MLRVTYCFGKYRVCLKIALNKSESALFVQNLHLKIEFILILNAKIGLINSAIFYYEIR